MIFVVPDVLLLSLLLATAFAVARLGNLIAVVMLLGLYMNTPTCNSSDSFLVQ